MSVCERSPVTIKGEVNPGRSADKVGCLMHCNNESMQCNAEFCLQL